MAQFEPVGLSKRSCTSDSGLIVTKHPIATTVGRGVMAAGGNAFDAAIAAAFALGVVEPYMSGIGGVGLAVVGDGEQLTVLDGGPVAPRGLDVDRYRLVDREADSDLFGWPSVIDDANILGATSVCVPTMVALMDALYRQGARLPWSDLVCPAVHLARDGYAVDWLLPLSILQDQGALRRYPSTASVFLPDDRVPMYDIDNPSGSIFKQPALAETLETIARKGPRVLYEGELAHAITNVIQSNGGSLSLEDLASYELGVSRPMHVQFAGADIWVTHGLNGGPTIAEMLWLYDALKPESARWGDARNLAAWVQAGFLAFRDRFAGMGHASGDRSWGTRDHEARCLEQRSEGIAAGAPDGSTTYLAVVDGDGKIVSMNLTLLSRWGSRFVVPDLGLLANNGIMWFDPVHGRPTTIAPGARPLANMAPVVVTTGTSPALLLGATGGRRIISALPQILTNVWQVGMGIQDAIQAPRLEFSVSPMLADSRFPDDTIREVERLTGQDFRRYPPRLASSGYSSPLGLLRGDDGQWTAGMDTTGMAESGCV